MQTLNPRTIAFAAACEAAGHPVSEERKLWRTKALAAEKDIVDDVGLYLFGDEYSNSGDEK